MVPQMQVDDKSSLIFGKSLLTGRRSSWDRCTSPSSCQMHWTTWKRSRRRRRTGAAHRPTSPGLLASPRDNRGFELCPCHSADTDVDEGDWQNNATMRFFDSRRLWRGEAPRVRLRDANQLPLGGRRILYCVRQGAHPHTH
ncbi:uncharacterized protein LOC144091313 [Stigmatopora argus]